MPKPNLLRHSNITHKRHSTLVYIFIKLPSVYYKRAYFTLTLSVPVLRELSPLAELIPLTPLPTLDRLLVLPERCAAVNAPLLLLYGDG